MAKENTSDHMWTVSEKLFLAVLVVFATCTFLGQRLMVSFLAKEVSYNYVCYTLYICTYTLDIILYVMFHTGSAKRHRGIRCWLDILICKHCGCVSSTCNQHAGIILEN